MKAGKREVDSEPGPKLMMETPKEDLAVDRNEHLVSDMIRPVWPKASEMAIQRVDRLAQVCQLGSLDLHDGKTAQFSVVSVTCHHEEVERSTDLPSRASETESVLVNQTWAIQIIEHGEHG